MRALSLAAPAEHENAQETPETLAPPPRPMMMFDEREEVEAGAEIISILAEALERIAHTTTDDRTRVIAELAMAEFHGR